MEDQVRRIGDQVDYILYREGSGDTVEIFDIAVNSERRRGMGKYLLTILFKLLGREKRVWAITRIDNEVAQQFYESCGFTVAGVLRRFYDCDDGADAVMYVRSSGGPL